MEKAPTHQDLAMERFSIIPYENQWFLASKSYENQLNKLQELKNGETLSWESSSQPDSQPACLLAFQPASQPARQLISSQPARQPTSLPGSLPASQPANQRIPSSVFF